MYCEVCGRKVEIACSCLNKNPVSRLEVLIIFTITLQIPIWSLKLFQTNRLVLEKDYLFIGSIAFSVLILLLTLTGSIFKRPYLALFFGCHQRIERTFKLFKKPLSICARCTGIYLGSLSTIVFHGLFNRLPFFVYLLLGIPLILDGFIQKKYNYTSNNTKRFLTGFLFGYFLVYIYTIYNVYLIRLLEIIREII